MDNTSQLVSILIYLDSWKYHIQKWSSITKIGTLVMERKLQWSLSKIP